MFPTEPVPERLGAYKVIRRLAGIGSADVYLGRMEGPMGFQRVCALKLVPNAIEGDARFAEELAREAAICAQLNHPAIVRMFDFFEHDRHLVLVLEHVDGADLERLLQHHARRKQRLTDNAIWVLAHHLAGALAHAHEATDENGTPTPVVHRNLTPENVLISWDGEVRLSGFGYGKILGRSPDTVIGTSKRGTPGFIAPEQQRGERATTRADVYGLGALLWTLLAGKRPPLDGSKPVPIGKLRSDIPREIAAAIDATLEPSHDKRRISCLELDQWLGKVTDVATGRAELREKILLLRSTRGEPSVTDTPRPSRTQPQPRRRVSLRSVKANPLPASGRPLSVARRHEYAREPTVPPPSGQANRRPRGGRSLRPKRMEERAEARADQRRFHHVNTQATSGRGARAAAMPPMMVIAPPVPAASRDGADAAADRLRAAVIVVSLRLGAPGWYPGGGPQGGWRDIGGDAASRGRASTRLSAPMPAALARPRPESPPTPLQLAAHHRRHGRPRLARRDLDRGEAGVVVIIARRCLPRSRSPLERPAARASADSQPSSAAAPTRAEQAASETQRRSPRRRPPGYAYLTVTAPKPSSVFLNGNIAGDTNEPIKVSCGRFYLRTGRMSDNGKYPIWLSAGTTVMIPCQGSMTVVVKPQ